jgi:hypothetical protein
MLTGAGHNCQSGQVQCQQTVVCCNNAGGVSGPRSGGWKVNQQQFQFCMGNIDFNMPITLSVNA